MLSGHRNIVYKSLALVGNTRIVKKKKKKKKITTGFLDPKRKIGSEATKNSQITREADSNN